MAYPYVTDAINELLGTDIHLPINMFGLWVAIAIIVAVKFTQLEVSRLMTTGKLVFNAEQQPKGMVMDLAFVSVLGGIAGAKLFDAIEQPQTLLADPLGVIFSTGGFSIYGGLIVGCIVGIIFLKRKKIALLPMLDAVAPALAIGYGIGRLGCQFSGDGDWGKPAAMDLKPAWLPDWLWAQTYSNNVLGIEIPAPGVYPTPLYEALIATLIFIILWQLRKKLAISGHLFCCYLILSGISRWLIEYVRINPLYDLSGLLLSQAQIISICLILIALFHAAFLKKHARL